ncbi:uncharacterized protein VTP21DRAFT_11074 [Calcarisporiella thermophila]|uniref:uncharacterized protein n=1 Tax=Calcarisporiella thermophila TaxID=911321 RepID=UPI003742ECAE
MVLVANALYEKDPKEKRQEIQPAVSITLTITITSTQSESPEATTVERATSTSTVTVKPRTSSIITVYLSSPTRISTTIPSSTILAQPTQSEVEDAGNSQSIIIALSIVGGVIILGTGAYILARSLRNKKRQCGWDEEEATTSSKFVKPSGQDGADVGDALIQHNRYKNCIQF